MTLFYFFIRDSGNDIPLPESFYSLEILSQSSPDSTVDQDGSGSTQATRVGRQPLPATCTSFLWSLHPSLIYLPLLALLVLLLSPFFPFLTYPLLLPNSRSLGVLSFTRAFPTISLVSLNGPTRKTFINHKA